MREASRFLTTISHKDARRGEPRCYNGSGKARSVCSQGQRTTKHSKNMSFYTSTALPDTISLLASRSIAPNCSEVVRSRLHLSLPPRVQPCPHATSAARQVGSKPSRRHHATNPHAHSHVAAPACTRHIIARLSGQSSRAQIVLVYTRFVRALDILGTLLREVPTATVTLTVGPCHVMLFQQNHLGSSNTTDQSR